MYNSFTREILSMQYSLDIKYIFGSLVCNNLIKKLGNGNESHDNTYEQAHTIVISTSDCMAPSAVPLMCEVDYTGTVNFHDYSIANDVTLKDVGKRYNKTKQILNDVDNLWYALCIPHQSCHRFSELWLTWCRSTVMTFAWCPDWIWDTRDNVSYEKYSQVRH